MNFTLNFNIPLLDQSLANLPAYGSTILLLGASSSGKLTLAIQGIHQAILDKRPVMFAGRNVDPRRVALMHTSRLSELALDQLRFLPEVTRGTILEAYMNPFAGTLKFAESPDIEKLLELLPQQGPSGIDPPQVVVIHPLELGPGADPQSAYEQSRRLAGLAATINTFARKYRCTVVATCLVKDPMISSSEEITPRLAADCRVFGEHFDAVIGISHLASTTRDWATNPQARYAAEQFLTVTLRRPPGGRDSDPIPVTTDFAKARFLPSERTPADGHLDPVTGESDAEKAKKIKASMGMPGWVKMLRGDLQNVLELRNPAALSIYFLLALRARHAATANIPKGGIFMGRDKICSATGLSDKQVRNSLEKLEETGLVRRANLKKGRAVVRIVATIANENNPYEGGGFLRLYRNLLDPEREILFRDPLKLAIWAICLLQARYKEDQGEGLLVGQFRFLVAQFQKLLPENIKPELILEKARLLVEEGRLRVLCSQEPLTNKDYVQLTNWAVYHSKRLTSG